MIIYGWRATHIKSSQLQFVECPNCKTKGSTVISVFGKYAHIFWIPLFPIGKTGASLCQNCNYDLDTSQMSVNIKNEYQNLKADTKSPIWNFIGLAIIAGIIAFGIIDSEQDKKKELELINSPLVNDVYRFRTESNNYSTLLVFEVLDDSIYIIPNDYEFTTMSGITEIEVDTNYNDLYYSYSRKEIKEMYEDGTIYDIIRE